MHLDLTQEIFIRCPNCIAQTWGILKDMGYSVLFLKYTVYGKRSSETCEGEAFFQSVCC